VAGRPATSSAKPLQAKKSRTDAPTFNMRVIIPQNAPAITLWRACWSNGLLEAPSESFQHLPQFKDLEESMSSIRYVRLLGVFALLAAASSGGVRAQDDRDGSDNREIKHVFVIALENHNWTQPTTVPGAIEPVFQNPNAPFINSLVNGTAFVYVDGHLVNISKQVAYATAYHNVLAIPGGTTQHIHPSEPNYLWAEAGTNFGVLNDNDPFVVPGGTEQPAGTQHLTGLLQAAGRTWKSYQEDIDLQTNAAGQLINLPLPEDQWTVPLSSFSGIFGPGGFLNSYNDSSQYNYAVKHHGMPFFPDTSGGDNPTTTNPLAHNYAPLQQLAFDLANDRVADYNWITPDQFNDMHSGLTGGFSGQTGDAANIKAGDNAVSRLVPLIMASKAYRDGGVIILWWDETESVSGENQDDFTHTLGEIIISRLARPNVNGLPYASSVNFTHSSDLRTLQEVFHVKATSGSSPFLGDAVNANDLSDLFVPGVIPHKP
jgi:phosphatidylinositol-3-phosphatase